ncbi:MAG: hypothetical protein RIC93_12530 [Alphaproteobacteria bacterium]
MTEDMIRRRRHENWSQLGLALALAFYAALLLQATFANTGAF